MAAKVAMGGRGAPSTRRPSELSGSTGSAPDPQSLGPTVGDPVVEDEVSERRVANEPSCSADPRPWVSATTGADIEGRQVRSTGGARHLC